MAAFLVLGITGALLGLGLAFASEIFYVEEDNRIEEVEALLPGYNCGACGYPGCSGFAQGIVEGEVKKLSLCKPGKKAHYDAIKEYLKDNPNSDGTYIQVTD